MSPRQKQKAYLWSGAVYWCALIAVGRYNILWIGISLAVATLAYLCFEAHARMTRQRGSV